MIDKKKLNSILNSNNEDLSKTERKINAYVLENPEEVIYESISSISAKLEIGEASLVRYFKKLGYQSFSHFRLELYKALESSKEVKANSYIDDVTDNLIEIIKRTKENIDESQLDLAAELILKSKIVFVAGMGLSHTSALDMFSKLLSIGVNANCVDDLHFSYMYSATLNKDSVVIIYTFSGETKEMIKVAEDCQARGAKIIAISNFPNSTIHDYADIFIETKCFNNDIYHGFFGSKIAEAYVSDLLITNMALRDEEKTRKFNLEAERLTGKRR